jgi:hypothetical protein
MKSFFITLLCVLTSCAAEVQAPATADAPKTQINDQRFETIAKEFPAGKLEKNIFTTHILRSDLEVGHIEMGQIPVAAGLHSSIYFYPCPCGKMNTSGQLCVVDYEVNEVIDELRAARIKIASVGPMFIGERPKLMMIRFHAEGDATKLAAALKKALSWMGDDRNTVPAENPAPPSP